MQKALIIHPYFGSHYKAFIFSELNKLFEDQVDAEFLVLQVFGNENSRAGMEINENEIVFITEFLM